ncbi:hypothetical protein [Ponticoccus alexandrii]|uniref:Uncharacterized protein n=1 Tax=Ponticoccus alexandrii TaxID=1943633 RepID=A0ABX7F856_9RHOB|nr:hypothetical protein [Ponticoccus alexandrii]QRF66720.1 hypothetical protein GQA70_10600 [Ponticoccus alexandrii]
MKITETPIRLRRDGSIDTAYYMQRGRVLRSQAAHDLVTARQETTRARHRGWLWGMLPI